MGITKQIATFAIDYDDEHSRWILTAHWHINGLPVTCFEVCDIIDFEKGIHALTAQYMERNRLGPHPKDI